MLCGKKTNELVKEATSKGFTHLSTRVQANTNSLEWTDITATQKSFVKLCFLTFKIHQTRQVFMLTGAQNKRHLPDHPHNFPLFAPRDAAPAPGSAPSCLQPATGATGLPGRAAPHLQTSGQLKSCLLGAGGGGHFSLFSHSSSTRSAEEKKAVLNTRFSTVLSPNKHFPTPLERGKPHTKEPTSCEAQAG